MTSKSGTSYPLVSVAIPVYNGSNYMRFAVDSVLAQTYPNCEILVVNDGSCDGGATDAIARSYGERIRYFEKINGGVASALNRALREARGEFFCWLSHDDVYCPEKIAREMDTLLSLPDRNSIVFCRHSIMDAEGSHISDMSPPPVFRPGQAAYQLILKQWLHCCTILARKSLYLECGSFREDLPTTQDYDLLVKMGLGHPFIEVPEVLLKARSHSEQGCLTLAHQEEIERFFVEHIPLLSEQYMHAHFSPQESVDAFIALGIQMHSRGYVNAILLVAKQLVLCESKRVEPVVLWNAIQQLMVREYFSNFAQPIPESANPSAKARFKTFVRKSMPSPLWVLLGRIRRQLLQKDVLLNEADMNKERELPKPTFLDFNKIYESNGFLGSESVSGEGSSLFQTRVIRRELPKLFEELNIKSILDVPCGDWNWMRHLDLSAVSYTGGDIVEALIDHNNAAYGNQSCRFKYLNIVSGPLPKADIILCRDCLVHLNYSDGLAALEQFRKSGAKWLLTTTFTAREENQELYEGSVWRPINLEKHPYDLPTAERYINEECTEGAHMYTDKCLALWRLS